MRYLQFKAISALFIEKSNAKELIGSYSNILMKSAKLIDKKVDKVEVPIRWQQLKVYGMSIARYLGEGKIEILCREIEFSITIHLKTLSCWLINKIQLEKRLESGNRRRSAIVIKVENGLKASKFYFKGLRFERVLKVVKK